MAIRLPGVVKAEIHEEGYHYVPYRFELDDQRIYTLLMGGAIYDNPLVAVRELVQNAVDACKLRDALTQLYEPYSPITTNRIVVTYEEPTEPEKLPLLSVLDTGTGMDAFVLERYFLKVGQSYYNSPEFKRQRIELRKSALDFAPISEFGIGFLSCFLLADRVQVETAMWESPRGDTRKRTLLIDGPTRLIRLKDEPNEGSKRFKGTRVTLSLRHQSSSRNSLNWPRICDYLRDVCRELPYRLHLHYQSSDSANETYIDPNPMSVEVPDYLEPAILRIPVADEVLGFEGEIALTDFPKARSLEREIFQKAPFELSSDADARSRRYPMYGYHSGSELRRGGFKIGGVPGLPRPYLETIMSRAKIRLTWRSTADSRYIKPNLARNHTADDRLLGRAISRTWITYLLEHRNELSASQLHNVDTDYRGLDEAYWLERFSAYEVYQLGRIQWCYDFRDSKWKEAVEQWEQGALQSIWLGNSHDLRADLLELVLPRICNLILSEDGQRYVSQPAEDWVRQLEQCRDFVTDRVRWGPFAIYTEKIKGLLFYGYPGYKSFNIRFKDRLASFKEEDLETLQEALYQMIRAREERQLPRLGTSEASIVLAAIDAAGELTVGAHRGLTWTLKSFAPPKT